MIIRVAKDIIAYCTSCRLNLVHTVVAMQDGKAVRVLCTSCKKEHAYRLSKGVGTAASKRGPARKSIGKKSENVVNDWEIAMKNTTRQTPKAYAMDGIYEAGDRITHSKFGDGLIRRIIQPNKMEVLFQRDVKTLVRSSS
jgi:hypothetical protein